MYLSDSVPLVSIITINRNNSLGLKKTMQSVFDLSFKDFEYVIIDGASTDDSVEVIKEFLAVPEYAQKISYWTSEHDSGIYNAMNKGIEHSKGKLIIMMNSGDIFFPDAMNEIEKIYGENQNSILYGAVNYKKDEEFDHCYAYSANQLFKCNIPHQGAFVPKLIYEKIGIYDESLKILADYDFMLKCYFNNVPFRYLSKIIANYDMGGISSTNRILAKKELKILDEKYNLIVKNKKTFKKVISYFLPYGFVLLYRKLVNFIKENQ